MMMAEVRSVLFVLLLAFGGEAAAATNIAYLDINSAVCSNYDVATYSCGAGSAENFHLASDIDGWFAGDTANRAAGGISRLVIVGAAAEADSVYLDLTYLDNADWLDLTGNECNGSAAHGIEIVADSGRPWHHFGAYTTLNSNVWTAAYDPADDRPLNGAGWGFARGRNMVYRTSTPAAYFVDHGIMLLETDPDEDSDWSQSVERQAYNGYHSDQGLGEFHDTWGVPWYSLLSTAKNGLDANGRGTPPKTIWNHGDQYEENGFMYWLTSDGAAPGVRANGEARKVVVIERDAEGIDATNCTTGIKLSGLHFSRMGHPMEISNSPGPIIENSTFSFMNQEGYYNIVIGYNSANAGPEPDNLVLYNNFFMLTRPIRAHRGDAFRLEDGDNSLVALNDFFMSAAHGEGLIDKQTGHFSLGNRVYYSFGKYAIHHSEDYILTLNEWHYNKGPYCDEENVPATSTFLLGGNGRCQSPGVWMDGDEDEKHPMPHAAGSAAQVFYNRSGGMSGWIMTGGVFGRGWGYNSSGRAEDILQQGNFMFRKQQGQRYAITTTQIAEPTRAKLYGELNTGFAIQDDWITDRTGRQLQTFDSLYENDLCADGLSMRLTNPWVAPCSEIRLNGDGTRSLSARNIDFDRNMWVQSSLPSEGATALDAMVKLNEGGTSRNTRSCQHFRDNVTGVTNHVCSTDPITVRNYPTFSRSNVDLAITATHAGVDQGAFRTTLKSNVSNSTSITIMDWRGFPVPSNYSAAQEPYIADAYDTVICGSPGCSGGMGWYPTAEYIAGGLPDGEYFIVVNGVETTYTALTRTGTGYEANLTLSAPITATAGDNVHNMPYCGSAPDIGGASEFCGASSVPDSLIANTDSYNVASNTTHSLDVLLNDRGFGDCADGDFQLKSGGFTENETLITALAINAGKVDVTLANGEDSDVRFTYTIEGINDCGAVDAVGTVILNVLPVTSGTSEQVYVQLDTPCDVIPGSSGWTADVNLVTSCGIPSDASGGQFRFRPGLASGVLQLGVRSAASSTDLSRRYYGLGHVGYNAAFDTGAVADIYRDVTVPERMDLHGYFTNSSNVTWNEPPIAKSLTCDSTWNTITGYTAGQLVLFHIADSFGQGSDIQFRYAAGGYETQVADVYYQPMLAANSSGNIEYLCPASGGVTELLELAVIDETVVTVPTGGWEVFPAQASLVAETISPTVTCPGDDGCVAYVVGMMTDPNRRADILSSSVGLTRREGNRAHAFFIVAPDANGDLHTITNNLNTEYVIVAGFNSGSTVSAEDPKAWELSTCTGTNPIDGVTPDVTNHGGTISSNGAACNGSGDLLIEVGEYVKAQTGVTLGEWEFSVRASGRYQIDFNHDGNGFEDGTNSGAKAGRKAVLDFGSGEALFATNTPDQTLCSPRYNLGGQFAANSEVFVRIVRSADGVSQMWLSDAAITDVETPVVTCTNTAGNDLGMVFQIRQQSADGLVYLPITLRSTQQADNTSPTASSVSCGNDGLIATCTWSPGTDPITNSSSGVQWIDVFADTSNPPTTKIGSSLSAGTTSISRTSATPETVYFDVRFSDRAANSATATTESVTTTTANNAPVIGTPIAATVPYGVELESEVVALNMVDLCAATDADGDSLSVASIVTQATNGVGTLRSVDSEEIDYQHNQQASATDSIVVTIKDTDGNVSGNCTVTLNPQGPLYVEPIIALHNRASLGEEVNYMVRLGPEHASRWEDRFNTWQVLEGTTAGNTSATCLDVSHPYACSSVKIYIGETDRYGQRIESVPSVGDFVTVMLIDIETDAGFVWKFRIKQ